MKETNVLKDWYLSKHAITNDVILVGTIYNDIKRRFKDGTRIQTSKVLKIDFVNKVVETMNSVYHLGN